MAKRRLLSTRPEHSRGYEDERQCLLVREEEDLPGSPTTSCDGLAYGTFCPSSPLAASSKTRSPRPGMAGPGKKRTKHRSSSRSVNQHQQQQLITFGRYSPWLWLKFSITLAFAIGCAFRSGPGSLLMLNDSEKRCGCSSCSNGKRRERLTSPS